MTDASSTKLHGSGMKLLGADRDDRRLRAIAHLVAAMPGARRPAPAPGGTLYPAQAQAARQRPRPGQDEPYQ